MRGTLRGEEKNRFLLDLLLISRIRSHINFTHPRSNDSGVEGARETR